jgi:hypothetical protein
VNIRIKTLVTVFFAALLTLSGTLITLRPALALTTAVSVEPPLLEFGPGSCVGNEFKINVVVSNVADLYGIDLRFAWNTEYLLYLNHTAHIPVEDYPGGIIHKPGMFVKNDVDLGAGTYWLSYASMAPAPPFDGSGIAFDMWFRIMKQPMAPEPDANITLDIVSSDLPNSLGNPITHERHDGTVIIHAKTFEYPPEPLLKILPASVSGLPAGSTFESSVYLMGEGGVDLDPFWDVAGFDVYVNFKRADPPYLILEALNVTIDPDGWFAGFWPGGVFEVEKAINNAEGWVHVAFLGLPAGDGSHTAPYGSGRLFNIIFNPIYESSTYPPPTVDITLKNPRSFVHRMTLDADAGLIDLSSPVGTGWTAIDSYDYGTHWTLDHWVDKDVNGKLSPGDELILTDTSTGKYHTYEMHDLKGTLTMTQQPFPASDDYLDMDGPTNKYTPWPKTANTGLSYNGYGNPNWTGNFSCTYPVSSVNYIEVTPQIGAPYNLTEGVDFVVNPDGTIWLKTPLDEDVLNEFVGTMPIVPAGNAGWPPLQYIASGIQSVYIIMPNGTERYARNNGFEKPPPAEWWYEPDFPYELESWWATGYFVGPYTWPDGTEIYVNYTAAAFIHVDYNAIPDTRPYYVEFDGTYADFLALGNPVGTIWKEIYPNTLHTWNCTGWTDSDSNGKITVGDYLTLKEPSVGVRDYLVDRVATDIVVDQVSVICDKDPSHPFYNVEPIVDVAGYPHPDHLWCPWHGSDSSVPLPCAVTSATFEAYFAALGASIDVYTQYPAPFGGQGPNKPSDMFWPQKEVILYAYVTYNRWPEQNKDVAFEVKDNHMSVWGIFYARTNEVGIAWVKVRLPWPCDDPDYYRGEWHVYATVDVACKVVNDTLTFKYDYLVNIWKVTTNKDSYAHCEDMIITIDYGSYAMQYYNITLTVTVVDETGVPFGYTYQLLPIGGAQYCTYKNETWTFNIHVVKFARAGLAKVYVSALSYFPQNGGCALSPLYTPPPEVGIEASWAP